MSGTPSHAVAARMALSVVIAMSALGCARNERAAHGTTDAGVAVDVPLVAFLSQARALHHEASVHEADDDLPAAIAALDRLTHAMPPERSASQPEVNEVLADAFARLAELHARLGDFAAAQRDVDDGLRHAREANYYRGHLLEVAGILKESVAARYADAGQVELARQTRNDAVGLLRQAVAIQERVISASLDAGAAQDE